MKPVVIEMDPRTIDQQIKAAVDNYCIAFFVEIVRSQDGRVLSPEQWRASLESCGKYDIVLIVDEAMTAVRCGAPFAHQLPEYRCQGRPDLVLFGKGIRTSGVAVDWNGTNIKNLGIVSDDNRLDVILQWQSRFTETASPESLLQSWGHTGEGRSRARDIFRTRYRSFLS